MNMLSVPQTEPVIAGVITQNDVRGLHYGNQEKDPTATSDEELEEIHSELYELFVPWSEKTL